MTDRIENDRQMHPGPGDASAMLVAQAYNLPQTDITIRQHYPQCHDQPHAGDLPGPSLQLGGTGGTSDSRSNAAAGAHSQSDSNSSATVGDVRSNSTSQGGNASATGGDARSNANGGAGGEGGDSAVKIDNSNNSRDLYMDATQPPAVLPGAPPATSFEYVPGNGSRFGANSNGSIDTTSVGVNIGLPGIGAFGVGVGTSRASNTEAVVKTSAQQQTSFDMFISNVADPRLGLPRMQIQQGALDEVRRGQQNRAGQVEQ